MGNLQGIGSAGSNLCGGNGVNQKAPLEGLVRLFRSGRIEQQLELFDSLFGWSVDRPLCHSTFFHHLLSTLWDDEGLSGDSGRPAKPVQS